MGAGYAGQEIMPPHSQFLTLAELAALPELQWLLEGVLPKPALAVIYGEPGCGKTFAALHIALCLTSGQECLGRKTAETKILYIAAEGVLGLKSRVRAFDKKFGIKGENFLLFTGELDLRDANSVAVLLSGLKDRGFVPGLVVVDTLARCTPGMDENSSKDMGLAVAGLDRIKQETGACQLLVHHTRKGGDSERGSSALRGAADVMILCQKQQAGERTYVQLSATKVKDAEPFGDITASFEKVPLEGGRTTLVLGTLADVLLGNNGHAENILKLLAEKFAEKGATHGELKKAFVAARYGSESTFNRAWRDVRNTDAVRVVTIDGKDRIFAGVSATAVSG